jgi:hypothetical protein
MLSARPRGPAAQAGGEQNHVAHRGTINPFTSNCGGDAQGKGVLQACLHHQAATAVANAPYGRRKAKAVRSDVAAAGSSSGFVYYPE